MLVAVLYGRKTGVLVSWLYVVAQLPLLYFLRALFATLSKRVGYALPVSFTPLETIPLGIAGLVTAIFLLEVIKARRARVARKVAEEIEEIESGEVVSEYEEELE